jgi:hypothetical protein
MLVRSPSQYFGAALNPTIGMRSDLSRDLLKSGRSFSSGRVPELHNLIVVFEFFGYHPEARQLGRTEGR